MQHSTPLPNVINSVKKYPAQEKTGVVCSAYKNNDSGTLNTKRPTFLSWVMIQSPGLKRQGLTEFISDMI
jgi:hypothetical protein